MLDASDDAADSRQRLREMILKISRADPDQARKMDDSPDISKVVSALFELVAHFTRGRPERNWTVDDAHPGFLVSRDDAGTMVAPFHLVTYLPSGEALEDIRAIAKGLKLGRTSALCLSGSVVLLGDPRYVGDLDFCEYISLSERKASVDRLAAIAEHRDALPACIRIRIEQTSLPRPWQEPITGPALGALLGAGPEGRRGKLDIITVKATTGPVEATNLLLWLPEANPDDYAALYSFPFQEMDPGTGPVGAVPWVPRQLARPSSIRSYVAFLKGDIVRYRQEKPIKALKRALSLATFLMQPEFQEELIALGHQTMAFQTEAIAQRQELVETVRAHADPRISALATTLQQSFNKWAELAAARRDLSQSAEFDLKLNKLIDRFLPGLR